MNKYMVNTQYMKKKKNCTSHTTFTQLYTYKQRLEEKIKTEYGMGYQIKYTFF